MMKEHPVEGARRRPEDVNMLQGIGTLDGMKDGDLGPEAQYNMKKRPLKGSST
jgi:hypothetical protein